MLRIRVKFLYGRFGGRENVQTLEWPPAPYRLVAALLSAANLEPSIVAALEWLEALPAPTIVAPKNRVAYDFSTYVADNDADREHARYRKPAGYHAFVDDNTVDFYWDVSGDVPPGIFAAVSMLGVFGQGTDVVIAKASQVDVIDADPAVTQVWVPAQAGVIGVRVPVPGSVKTLRDNYNQRMLLAAEYSNTPLKPLLPNPPGRYATVGYRVRDGRPVGQTFALVTRSDRRKSVERAYAVDAAEGWRLADAVKGAAIGLAQRMNMPERVIGECIAGHAADGSPIRHQQRFSFIPLPMAGRYADGYVRRVMVTASPELSGHADALFRALADYRFKREDLAGVTLRRVDSCSAVYTRTAKRWHSVTPVILPGYVQRQKDFVTLVNRAFEHAGLANVTWQTSRIVDNISVPACYRGYGVTNIMFESPTELAGPVVLGAGKHYGFGLFIGDK